MRFDLLARPDRPVVVVASQVLLFDLLNDAEPVDWGWAVGVRDGQLVLALTCDIIWTVELRRRELFI